MTINSALDKQGRMMSGEEDDKSCENTDRGKELALGTE